MIYLIEEKILFYNKTIAVCNNVNELIILLNKPEFLKKIKGEVNIKKVAL